MIKIIRACSVKIDDVIQHLRPGETLNMPSEKELKIVRAGYAEPADPDIAEYRKLCAELAECDPKAGCWDWVTQHQPEVWQRFMQTLFSGDLAAARTAFDTAVTAWKAANNG
ncbi:MAG: hypothetical protein FIA89_04760 [Geobacter sp.]|nr:hypothetical protein [Geobacter sp.]